jgi:hypothetical protein
MSYPLVRDLATEGIPVRLTCGVLLGPGVLQVAGPAVLGPGRPDRECDVVTKGGIVSGVVYPGALHVIGSRYRIRGIGGASAGAIGAAVGAAAELGGSPPSWAPCPGSRWLSPGCSPAGGRGWC